MKICKGERILLNEPWVWVLDSRWLGHRCDFCFQMFRSEEPLQTSPANRCQECCCVFYCSALCKKKHADALHSLECRYLKNIGPASVQMLPRSTRSVFLALLKTAKGQVDETDTVAEPKTGRTWERLISHWDKFRGRPDFVSNVHCTKLLIDQLVSRSDQRPFTVDEIGEAMGKCAVNSFTIVDWQQNETGCGIYLSGSVFDHSCIPNASKYFVGKNLVVYALQDIASLEQVRIAYTVLYEDPGVRRQELEHNYHFRCDCGICMDTQRFRQQDFLNGWRCQKKAASGACDGLLVSQSANTDLLTCDKCGWTTSDVRMFHQKTSEAKQLTQELMQSIQQSSAFPVSMDALQTLKTFLLPSNRHLHELYDMLTLCAEQSHQLHLAVDFCLDTLQPYAVVYPEGCFEVLAQLAKFITHLARFFQQQTHKNKEIPKVTASFYAAIAKIFQHKCQAIGLPLLTEEVIRILDDVSVKKHVEAVINKYMQQKDVYTVRKLIDSVTVYTRNSSTSARE